MHRDKLFPQNAVVEHKQSKELYIVVSSNKDTLIGESFRTKQWITFLNAEGSFQLARGH